MLNFHVVNLLVPGDPEEISLEVPSGIWFLRRHLRFAEFKDAIGNGQCAETYYLEHPVTLAAGAAAVDRAFDEVTPILLSASYLTGLSITIRRSAVGSEVSILQPSEHWPRPRAMGRPSPVITSTEEFRELVELFVQSWPQAGRTEKALLLVHHWLDAVSCWSMEDLYLSATTLLQIIAATEANRQSKTSLEFYPGIRDAARRMQIQLLSDDFKNMRNELIHDGQLIGRRFAGPDKLACAAVVAEVLNWFDKYLHEALGLGLPRATRFCRADLVNLNAYSIA